MSQDTCCGSMGGYSWGVYGSRCSPCTGHGHKANDSSHALDLNKPNGWWVCGVVDGVKVGLWDGV